MNSHHITDIVNSISVRKSDLILSLSNISFQNKVIGNITNLDDEDEDLESSSESNHQEEEKRRKNERNHKIEN